MNKYTKTKRFGFEIPNSDKELRKLIENSNWNFILQTIRDLQEENKALKEKLEIYNITNTSGFNKLSKKDQKEVINLIKLKNKLKGASNEYRR